MPELSGGSRYLEERLIICVGEGLDTVECGPGQFAYEWFQTFLMD